MNIKDFSVLAIKISGIILLVLTISKLPEYFEQYTTRVSLMPAVTIWHYIIPVLIPTIISIILIIFPYTVSNAILFDSSIDKKDGVSFESIETIAIRILGLFLMNSAVAHLVYLISNVFMMNSIPEQDVPRIVFNYPGVFSSTAEFVFSLWLLFGAKNISHFLRKLSR